MQCPGHRLYLATKLANPHYRPEIAAQTTLVNFCVTEEGLEEQLLAAVVDHERADLQQAAAALVAQLGQYTITLTELENNLLARLANSQVWRATRMASLSTNVSAATALTLRADRAGQQPARAPCAHGRSDVPSAWQAC